MTDHANDSSCLCVFAHPDDEAFRCGGTLALMARSDVRVWVLSFTSGEAGSCGTPPLCTPEELGSIRKEELKCSCRALGLEAPIVLDYPDGQLAAYPEQQAAETLEDTIWRLRPQIMITWPPHGLSGHADHRAVSGWAGEAFSRIRSGGGNFLKSLYYTAVPQSVADALGMDGLHAAADSEISIEIDVSPVRELKNTAIRCHRTQAGSSPILESSSRMQDVFLGKEHFIQASPDSGEDALTRLNRKKGRIIQGRNDPGQAADQIL